MKNVKLGDLLLENNKISKKQLNHALTKQQKSNSRLGEILVELNYVTEEDILTAVSQRLAIPKIALSSLVIDPSVIKMVPVNIARRYSLIPIFSIGNSLTLAMEDPLNIIAIDEINFLTKLTIKRAIASRTEILNAIDRFYSVADSMSQIIGESDDSIETNESILSYHSELDSETPVIKLVNLLLSKAIRDKASDIHIEPEESRMRIRYRISGVMREEAAPPKKMQNELISRIKIMSDMDVSEKRLPQDGRFMLNHQENAIDLRVSTLPTIHGEKIVIRILDRRNLQLSFEQLGFNAKLEKTWQEIIHKPEGMILISGPTSSGKTSTLYASLQEINSIEKNIITVEDPVEYSLPIINQIQINEKAGLTFPSILRSILRQNPDIIMIGEIRDIETAKMAIRSSLTGHLVFSTIHTNDAPSTLTRLVDMGIDQRLVRTNCKDCLTSYKPSQTMLDRAGLSDMVNDIKFKRGDGCPQCRNSGFSGQVGIFEFIEITPQIAEAINNNSSINKIKHEARKCGYVPIFEMGLEKVSTGIICLEELLKETSNIEDFYATQETIAEKNSYAKQI